MAQPHLLACLALAVAACGSKPPPTSPETGGGVEAGDTPTCEPGRCLEDIAKLIAERRSDARACYEEGLKRDPKLAGIIIINFAIDSEGVVGETEQSMKDAQIEDQQVVACVGEVIKTVRFAPSAGGKTTRAYHRFEFNP